MVPPGAVRGAWRPGCARAGRRRRGRRLERVVALLGLRVGLPVRGLPSRAQPALRRAARAARLHGHHGVDAALQQPAARERRPALPRQRPPLPHLRRAPVRERGPHHHQGLRRPDLRARARRAAQPAGHGAADDEQRR